MISSFIRNYFVMSVVLFVSVWFLPNVSLGYPVGRSFTMALFLEKLPVFLVTTLLITFLSLIARPVLKLLALPINFMTLGLFNIVINVFLIWLTSYLVPEFQISRLAYGDWQFNLFFSYAAVSVVFGLAEGFLGMIF